MVTIKNGFVLSAILFYIFMAMAPCGATEPAWIFTDNQINIGDVVVAPDGSAVVAAAGKVLLFSRNGTVLAKEPFGEVIFQSRDGSLIITGYSSPVSSTVYVFKKKTDENGILTLQKLWETILSNQVSSIAISDKGERVALSSGGTGIEVFDGNTGKILGYSDAFSSLIAISARGNTIAGISRVQGLKVYTSRGALNRKYDIILAGQPTSFLMNDNGNIVVLAAGPYIYAFNVSDGSEIWKKRSSGDVTSMAMTPAGYAVAAGTGNGVIELYDARGDLNWSYNDTGRTGSGHAVNAIALTRDGSKIVAGSDDGRILLLDSAGNLLWNYDSEKGYIRKVAVAADGSLTIAAEEHTLYAFTTGPESILPKGTGTAAVLPSRTFPSEVYTTAAIETGSTHETVYTTQQTAVHGTPVVSLTEYSVIRKATPSSVHDIIGIAALIILVFIMRRNIT